MQIEKGRKEEESIAFFYLRDDVIMQICSLRKKRLYNLAITESFVAFFFPVGLLTR